MDRYSPKTIEPKWQKRWEETGLYKTADAIPGKDNYYQLVEFPYPSGNLHVGHWYAFCGPDIHARYMRMIGKNVLFPIGFDAFGLPAENAAIKRGLNPRIWTEDNMAHMRKQIDSMGASFDRSREVVTCHPEYYRWTQWLFIQLWKAGLVAQRTTFANWCASCKTILANEQVKNGVCERCSTEVTQKEVPQWQMLITKYADRLIDDLDRLDWAAEIKQSQKNWIGRSEGIVVKFPIVVSRESSTAAIQEETLDRHVSQGETRDDSSIEVFTTRVDTIFSGAFLVLAPEHEIIKSQESRILNLEEIRDYLDATKKKSEIERTATDREKTGVELKGFVAINPATGKEMPIWISDFVLGHYGTGAVFADAHDQRDFDMAKKYGIPITVSIRPENDEDWLKVSMLEECYEGDGILVNSGKFDGMTSAEAREKMTTWLEEKGMGRKAVNYKLRDWTISRQRYWGVPIPLIHCEKCGWQAVPDEKLPVELPEIDDYLPREDGKSPLAKVDSFVKTVCPNCGGGAGRETDTMDTFVDSSWYFLRYTNPNNERVFALEEKLNAWMPVDFYSGGAEHVTMHLLYSRFFHKALFDLGLVPENEPYVLRRNRGLILGPDGNKMSKSKGNVIDPDEVVADYGADTIRLYLSFIGPYNEVGNYPWNPDGVIGVRRFLDRVWRVSQGTTDDRKQTTEEDVVVHKTLKKVTESIEQFKLNTGVAALMTCLNMFEKSDTVPSESWKKFLIMLSLFAPHIAEELWEKLGEKESIFLSEWPKYDPEKIVDEMANIAVQINGKVRAVLSLPVGSDEESVKAAALADEKVQLHIAGKEIRKVIFVQDKILNIVV